MVKVRVLKSGLQTEPVASHGVTLLLPSALVWSAFHATSSPSDRLLSIPNGSNGFVVKKARFEGRVAHAGAAPQGALSVVAIWVGFVQSMPKFIAPPRWPRRGGHCDPLPIRWSEAGLN